MGEGGALTTGGGEDFQRIILISSMESPYSFHKKYIYFL